MRNFRAILINSLGYRLTIFFKNENWNEIEKVANAEFMKSIYEPHYKHGPWNIIGIEVEA